MPTAGLYFVLAAVAVGGLGALVADQHRLAIGAAALVLTIGVFATDPILLPVVALPGAFLLQRVGSSGTNLSVSDLLVFLGAVVALLNVDWKAAPHLRRFLVGVVVYEVILIVVVAFHPNRDDVIEWLHRFSDLGGSAIIGWVIAAHRRVRQALRLYLLGAAIIALLASTVGPLSKKRRWRYDVASDPSNAAETRMDRTQQPHSEDRRVFVRGRSPSITVSSVSSRADRRIGSCLPIATRHTETI